MVRYTEGILGGFRSGRLITMFSGRQIRCLQLRRSLPKDSKGPYPSSEQCVIARQRTRERDLLSACSARLRANSSPDRVFAKRKDSALRIPRAASGPRVRSNYGPLFGSQTELMPGGSAKNSVGMAGACSQRSTHEVSLSFSPPNSEKKKFLLVGGG